MAYLSVGLTSGNLIDPKSAYRLANIDALNAMMRMRMYNS